MRERERERERESKRERERGVGMYICNDSTDSSHAEEEKEGTTYDAQRRRK